MEAFIPNIQQWPAECFFFMLEDIFLDAQKVCGCVLRFVHESLLERVAMPAETWSAQPSSHFV